MDPDRASGLIAERLGVSTEEARIIVEKATIGGEVQTDLEHWVNERFLPNVVLIGQEEYARAAIDALKIAHKVSATDFGGSRQRDFGQVWADMTRGYIGESALKLFLEQKGISVQLGHELGELSDYLPSDIRLVKRDKEDFRPPRIQLGIKALKMNGIWGDFPGDQFNHSHVHVAVKIGSGRDHLFGFLKSISVFKDKVLPLGEKIGLLTADQSAELFDRLPSFRPIPAYMAGFVRRDQKFGDLPYHGQKGRKHFTITEWNGPIRPGDLDKIKEKEHILGNVKFQGINEFSHDQGYLFNIGQLKWRSDDWEGVISEL